MRPIDADALKERFGECPYNWTDLPEEIQAVFDWKIAMNNIDEAPTIDAASVSHGRWVKMTGMLPPEYHGHYECSECQWHMKGLRNSWTREEELTYCPNCGAKMNGGESNEDT